MLRNADGGGCQIFQKKVLRRCRVLLLMSFNAITISVTRGWVGVHIP